MTQIPGLFHLVFFLLLPHYWASSTSAYTKHAMTTLKDSNNLAASLIGTGRCTEAYYELRGAMNALAQTIKLDDTFKSTPGEIAFGVTPLALIVPNDDACTFSSPLMLDGTEPEEYTVESASCACATALFNMALACHFHIEQGNLSLAEQRQGLDQARDLYTQAYQISKRLDVPLLNLALCNNLLEMAFEDADTDAIFYWRNEFGVAMDKHGMAAPADVLVHLLKVQLWFMPPLQAARAA